MEKNERPYWPAAPGRLFSTLRSRLIALVLLASLPALALIVYTNVEQRRHDTNEAVLEALSVIRQVSKDQMDLVRETRTLLSVLSRTIDISDGPAMSRLFVELVREQGTYSNIGFIGPDGHLVASALPFKPPVDVSDRTYFRQAAEGLEFSVGKYQIGKLTGTAGVNFGYPVVTQGSLKGVLFAALPIGMLSKKLAGTPLQEDQAITIADSAGVIIARHPFERGWVGEHVTSKGLDVLLGEKAEEGYAQSMGTDGVERVYSYIKLGVSEDNIIYIVSGIPASVVYAKADRLLLRNAATLAGITMLVLFLAWFASDKLVLKSIRELVALSRELGAGKRKSRARVDSGSEELNYLARSLNEMADALEEREEEAERHLARIARLNRVYAVLSGINSTIIRNIGKDELLREACRVAVEQGYFAFAWAALLDDSGRLYPAAWAGGGKKFIDELMRQGPSGTGVDLLTTRSVTEDRMIICDLGEGADSARFMTLAAGHGFRSAAAFPLRVGGSPVGSLSLYSAEPDFFNDQDELKLLAELAADTSLGLEKIENEKRLDYLSRFDALTGLVNRWVFEDHLAQALTRSKYNQRHVAVVMLDIEDFSRVNDTLGHSAGDEVLKTLARYLSGSVRDGDTVARIGNDNFGVILQDLADREDAVMVVEKMMDGLPSSVEYAGERIFIKTYSGISIHPGDGATTEELMRNTELAMHASDASGKGQPLYYSKEINAKALERRGIENELRHAIEKKELELVYQPIVAVEDRRIIAVEALLRWTSQKLGPVPPDKFIPVAEKTGLIVPIGEWVIKTAVAQAREWERQGISDLKVGVNVSVRQIRQPDFCERLERVLGYGFGSRAVKLAIEVTESELMKNMDIFVKSLTEMRRLGLFIYIDDFGTGYSSLSYLKDLPIDTLKIDRSFIKDLATDSSSLSMAMGIIAIANSLGLDVVAEGVEKDEQLVILDDLGCGAAQGYLFSKPLPAKLVEPLLLKRQ